jgi:Fe2+ or Zn2+ uptake regulation protein
MEEETGVDIRHHTLYATGICGDCRADCRAAESDGRAAGQR